jgi:L-ascorbate metabolism protein UlaG (beta-lactamase superfamily)
MSDREFPKHFDGRRFYNPDAPQARGFLDVLQWKLTSRLEPSPEFISDVEQSTPPRRVESSELRITARGIFDRNKTLWCGYAIEFPERLVYFAGDTGFGNHFAQIREKFGSPQLALLPSEHMSHAGLCRRCTWLPKRRLEPIRFSVPRPASRSTTEPSSWRMTASTLHR